MQVKQGLVIGKRFYDNSFKMKKAPEGAFNNEKILPA